MSKPMGIPRRLTGTVPTVRIPILLLLFLPFLHRSSEQVVSVIVAHGERDGDLVHGSLSRQPRLTYRSGRDNTRDNG